MEEVNRNEQHNNLNILLSNDLIRLLNESLGIACNANDLFGDGRADTVIIDPKDLEWVLPIYIKYNGEGLDACMAYIAKQIPIDSDITKSFKEAYAKIEIINPKVYSFYPFN
jgi:hypothetical protein